MNIKGKKKKKQQATSKISPSAVNGSHATLELKSKDHFSLKEFMSSIQDFLSMGVHN